jgi:disulfide bond formation protein DsbB
VLFTGLLFLGAALHRAGRAGAIAWGSLIAVVAAIGAAIAARHVWITAQPPGTVAECGASLDYMLDVLPLREVLAKVLTGSGECGKVDWRFLGLSMPAWVLAWLLALGAWGLFVNLRRR